MLYYDGFAIISDTFSSINFENYIENLISLNWIIIICHCRILNTSWDYQNEWISDLYYHALDVNFKIKFDICHKVVHFDLIE